MVGFGALDVQFLQNFKFSLVGFTNNDEMCFTNFLFFFILLLLIVNWTVRT